MNTYVLVHGVNQGGWIWKPVAKYLRMEGHDVYTPTMDGCAERRHQLRPEITITTQIAELLDCLFYDDLTDIILAGSSAAGMHISKMAEMMPDRIKHLVYVDAVLLRPDEKAADVIIPEPGEIYERTELGWMPKHELLKMFKVLSDDPERNDWASERFSLWPTSVKSQDVDLQVFWSKTWNATVINCTLSKNPSTAHVRQYSDKLQAKYIEMNTGHWPMVSRPEELAQILLAL
ncbi:MAG: alpha/beta hydrolase [Deltaproteobacteria bacterium]|nr:alpha/beta hydrolase [Deltaproteobacteria bacterium]